MMVSEDLVADVEKFLTNNDIHFHTMIEDVQR